VSGAIPCRSQPIRNPYASNPDTARLITPPDHGHQIHHR
jgi:hypothetical protein